MKKLILLAAFILPLAGEAASLNDTTLTYRDKTIIVRDSDERIAIDVRKGDGEEMQKISSTSFVDGQEVEQVYVTSPFIPNSGKRKQNFVGSLPGVYIGVAVPAGNSFGFKGANDMHTIDHRCGEFGISAINFGTPFNYQQTFGLVTAVQFGFGNIHFNKNFKFDNIEDRNEVVPIVSEKKLKDSWLKYCYIRIPLLLDWQKKVNGGGRFVVGAGVSVAIRSAIHSRYKDSDGRHSVTKDININTVGLGFDAHVGYAGIQLYFHTDLTPMFNTAKAPKCYNTSLGIGFLM